MTSEQTPRTTHRYTHGHGAAVLASHSRRTAQDSAGYLLPHLRRGMDLLDVGCGPASVTADLAMVAGLADERGKVPAWTEFGPYEGTEPDSHWFTSVLGALKADQNASRIAWMLTWANYGHGDREHAYVPYPAHGDHPEHPLLADFRVFHDNPSTVFAKEWKR